MTHNAEEWRRLRSEFIEAAAEYDEYETFIERTAQSEDWHCNNGRYLPVGLIRWPYGPYRKCWILAPDSGEDAEPFSAMKTLFSKAWLWLPRVIADEVVDTAEIHLSEPSSPPNDWGLYWAKSYYQYWCWLLWFHWLRQQRAANPTEAERPSRKMVMSPFHCSADLIAQWGLDGSDGTIPEWLAAPVIDHKGAASDVGHPGSGTTEPAGPEANASGAADGKTESEKKSPPAMTDNHDVTKLLCDDLREFADEMQTEPNPSAAMPKPSWNRIDAELSFDGGVIRKIRRIGIAKNVVLVLDTFQELGWPNRVDSPLSPGSQKHHATIDSLNTGLSRIRFKSDGEGKGFVWECL